MTGLAIMVNEKKADRAARIIRIEVARIATNPISPKKITTE